MSGIANNYMITSQEQQKTQGKTKLSLYVTSYVFFSNYIISHSQKANTLSLHNSNPNKSPLQLITRKHSSVSNNSFTSENEPLILDYAINLHSSLTFLLSQEKRCKLLQRFMIGHLDTGEPTITKYAIADTTCLGIDLRPLQNSLEGSYATQNDLSNLAHNSNSSLKNNIMAPTHFLKQLQWPHLTLLRLHCSPKKEMTHHDTICWLYKL